MRSKLIFFLLVIAAAPLWAQTPLTLSDAVKIALEKNPVRKAALADQRAAKASVGQARSFLLPHVTFAEGFTRGDDPVYVFGSKLRQQSFSMADFALPVLNTPGPINNWSTRIATQWNVFDSGASWFGLARSRKLAEAAGQQLERSDQELLYRVINAYYGALLADKQVEVAEAALKSAQSVQDVTSSRHQAGMVVEADLLAAQVNRGNRQQELIRAKNNALLARAQLNNELGLSFSNEYTLPQQLAERPLTAATISELETTALDKRPDLRRIRLEQAAQEKGVASAKALFGPRLNFFLGYEADNRNFASNGGTNAVGGFELQVDIFQGGAKMSNLSMQKAFGERVAAMRAAAENGVRLEVRKAYLDWDANRQQVEVARASVDQAKESLRIMQNRYESGLVTMTELLRAEEAADRAQNEYWQVVSRVQTSYAGVELAAGTLSAQSPVVMP